MRVIDIVRKLLRRAKAELANGLFLIIDRAAGLFGYELLKKHFYSPMPLDQDRTDRFLHTEHSLVGIDIDTAKALAMAEQDFQPSLREFRQRFPLSQVSRKEPFWQELRSRLSESAASRQPFCLLNGNYMAVDAHIYWSMIRTFKPKRIIEIGAGNSTVLAAEACLLNEEETGIKPELIAVEPYPSERLRAGMHGLTRLIEQKVQDADPALWAQLDSGDILFIDSSHVLASGNDVHYEYQELLPRLKRGVLVHLHDISLPMSYPQSYFDRKLYWNEQYLLQALLTHSYKFEVIWPGNYLMVKAPADMLRLFPEITDMRKVYPQSEPSAFWIRSKV